MVRRKLLKRALPLLLSVSMVFGSMPTTALAAEYDESAVIEETVLDESETADENAESSDDAPENPEREDSKEAEESKTSDINTAQETETADADDDNKAETEVVAETEDAVKTEGAAETIEAAELNAEAALATEIVTKNLENYVYGSLRYVDDTVTGTYTGEGIFDYFINQTVKSTYNDAVQVKVDSQVKENLKSNLTYKWKKADADGNYTVDLPAGETPVDAGAYRLEISLEAAENVCSAATANVDFKIEQAVLKLEDLPTSVKIGETLTAFVEGVKENYTLRNKDTKEQMNKDVFVKSFEVTLADAVTGEKLSYDANTVFAKDKDYTYNVSVELNDANYELEETEQIVIGLSGDIETSMEVTLPKLIEYTYTGEKIALPVAGTDYMVKVTYQTEDQDGVVAETEIKDPAITAEWADADGIKFGEDEAPVNAGSYKLVLTFTDTTGRYAECVEDINVTVNPISVYVKPSLTTTEYPSGVSESDILKNVEYEVLKTADDQAPTGFSKDTFWGVSYNNADRTQPYEPVFTLQVSELLLDGEGKPVKDADGKVQYSDFVNNNGASLIAGSVDGNVKANYRVVFSGKKAVFYASGNAVPVDVNDHGTNGADTNHKVDLSADTISKYVADVTITEAKLVTIDTSAFANDEMTKIYDGQPFHKNRQEYKKAAAEGGTLTYTWRKAQKVVSTDAEGNETVDYKLGDEVFAQNDTDVNENKYWGVSPYEVGTYMLVISYDDPTGASVAKDAQVGPYVIEKQKVQAEISLAEGAALVTYTGVSISDFKDDCQTSVLNVVKPIVDNVMEPIALGDALGWNARYYDIEFVAEYQDNLTEEWKEATENAFVENRKYRLRAKVNIKNATLNRYYQSYELNKDNEAVYYLSNALDIEVKKMGTAEIAIHVDESKITNKVKKYDGESFAVPTDAVSVVTVKDGQPVTDLALTYKWLDHTDNTRKTAAIDSGKYTLYIGFDGNENYKPYNGEIAVTGYEITKRSVTVKPVVKETVTAGTIASYSNVVADYVISDASDILESELFLFDGFYDEVTGLTLCVIDSTTGVIYESDGKTRVSNNVLKGDKTYYAAATRVFFNEILDELFYFSRNYEVKYEKTEFKPIRGNAIVTGDGTSVKDYVAEMTHTIAPKEGVPYYYRLLPDGKENSVSGNFLIFNVKAPQEYYVNGNRNGSLVSSAFAGFVYKNSLKEAGGYVIDENEGSGQLKIAIPITKEDVNSGAQKSFKIRWEDGYLETFTVDCKGVVLEDDLTKAVAPKSLAFNSPVTKMIVGEKQQLDVKVTKTNLDDIICLKYETADTSVLSVSDTGAVVALGKGSAAVEAIPCYIDENGEKQPIDGAKRATVKISVADVTAPKIKSVTAYDRAAKITYPAVSDGYRREIYVLEGKNLKNDAFESKISAMKNGDWKTAGFAAKPVYNTDASTVKGAMTEVWVTGLQPGPNKDYTVYVRNVSGIRTLADGTTVAASAAGSAKGFAMTLPQVSELGITFDDQYYNPLIDWYMVPLSEKSVQTITTGWFQEIYTNSSANTMDRKEYVLPLDKELASKYAQPKLNYYVSKYYDGEEIDINDLKNTSWSAATDIAKIDKKGKLTLTGVGIVYVLVVDTVTENYDIVPFIITATADRMEIAKSVKLKVGQKVDLFDLVTYYEDKTKLTGYVDYKNDLASLGIGTPVGLLYGTAGDTDGFIIETQSTVIDILRKDLAGEVTAVKPNAAMTVLVSDEELNQEPVAITFASSAIDPVKALKTTMVTDQYATISFTYPLLDTDWEWYNTSETKSSNQVYFRIQVKDASKRVVSDRYYNMFDDFEDYSFDAKKNVMTLTATLGGLTRKSSYTVSVTACYLDQMSKEASKGIKTTDVPAAYPYEHYGSFDYEYSKLPTSDYMTADGGIMVLVGDSAELSAYPTLTSNNTYTLIAFPDNVEAKNRLSDTLTWKSTNTKVASVKANAGTYTAALKTVRKGTTKIEISSKLTKRVIARWTVIVNAVGEASYYFGDFDTTSYDGMNEAEYGELQLLTIDNPVKATLESGEGISAKFVAPAYGQYTFTSDNLRMRVYDGNGTSKSYLTTSYSQQMKQGETLYFMVPNGDSERVTVTLRAAGTIYQAMDLSGITLMEYGTVVFTAPEDNYYSVYRNGSDSPYRVLGGMKQGEECTLSLPAGTYTIEKRTLTGTLTTGELKDVTVPANTTNWYVFTAPEDMEYTFAKTSEDLGMRFYDDITSSAFDSRMKRAFEKNKKVYIAVVNDTEEEIKTDITISAAAEVISATQPSTITLTDADQEVWAQLKLEDAGKYNIKITAAAEEGATPNLTVRRAQSTGGSGYTIDAEGDYTFSKGQIIYLSFSSDTANTKVTVTVSKVTGTTQSISEESTEAAINADSYVFTAQTAGEYVFSAEPVKGADDAEIPVYVRVYDAEGTLLFDTRYMSRAASSGSYTLAAGQKVYVRYYTQEDTTAAKTAIKITKLSAEVFTDTWNGTLKTGETKWLQFRAPADARYFFTTETKQTSEDGNGTVNGYVPNTGYYKQGQGFEARLTAYNADVEYTITVSPVNPQTLTNAEFELKAKETKWFKYTAAETGKYKVALTGDVTVSGYYDLESLRTFSFGNEISLDAGQTIYYKVENSSEAVQKATLAVTQITADAMTLESNQKETELSNGEYAWYSFKASKPGYYRIESVAEAEEGKYASANKFYYANLNEDYIEYDYNLDVVYLAANETVFAKVSCNTNAEKARVTTTLTAMNPTDVTPASAPVEKKDEKIAASGNCNWYSISGEGTYALTISDTTSQSYRIYYVKNGESGFRGTSNDSIELTLGTEDTYTIAVRANTDEFGYTLTTAKRDVKQLSLTEIVSASLKQGDELYVSFTAPETGRYAVMLDGLTGDVTANMDEISGNLEYDKNTNTYWTFYNEINDKVIFKIDGVNSETPVNLTLKAVAVTAETVTDLTESGKATIDVNSVTAGHMLWYGFKAPESGEYLVKSSDAALNMARCYDSLDRTFLYEISDQVDTFYMGKDQMIYFAVWCNEKPSANIEFSVGKFETHELTVGGSLKVDTKDVVPGERYHVSFTAPEEGIYTFLCAEEVDAEAGVVGSPLVKLSINTICVLEKNQECVFDAVYADKALKGYTISVVKQEIKPIAAEGTEFTLKAGDYQYVSITPETNCNVTIAVEADGGIEYTRAQNSINDLTSDYAFIYGGTTNFQDIMATTASPLYIGFHAFGEGTVKVSYTEGDSLETLQMGNNYLTVESDVTRGFTAPEDGVYFFAERTKESIQVQVGGKTYNNRTYLRSGDTALVTVRANGNISRTISVTAPNVTKMTLDQTDIVPFSDGTAYVQFDAAQQGMYVLSSHNSSAGYIDAYKLNENNSGWEYITSTYGRTGSVILDAGTYIAEIYDESGMLSSADYTISYWGKSIFAEEGETPTHFTVNNNESVYVRFYTGGSMQFDILADKRVKVEYIPSLDKEEILVGEGTSIRTRRYTREDDSIIPCFKITGTQNNTNIDFSYMYVEDARMLKSGYNEVDTSVDEPDYIGYVDYTYFCERSGDHNFKFYYEDYENEEGDGISKIEIYNAADTSTLLKTIDHSQCSKETCYMDYGAEYIVRIYMKRDSGSEIYIYPMNVNDVNEVPYDYFVDYDEGMLRFAFTASESGTYEFYSSATNDETYVAATLYDATGNWLSSDSGTNFRIRCDLNAGDTVWLDTKPDEGIYGSYYVHIRKRSVQSYVTDTVSGEASFTFTAPEDGEYEFYSTYTEDNVDTYATLYDAAGNEITHDDDSGENLNFSIKYSMSAGDTVRLEARPLNMDNEGSYCVHIEKI